MYELPTPPDSRAVYSRLIERDIKDLGLKSQALLPHMANPGVLHFLAELEARERGGWIDGIEPVPFDEWCVLLDDKSLTTRQRWVFEHCNILRASDVFSSRRVVQELDLVWGKGAGKGYVIAKLFSWLALVLCSMKDDPALRFNLARETKLVMMNVAPTEELAKNVFFAYLKRFLMHPLIQRFMPTMNTEDVKFFRQGRYGSYEWLSIYSRHSNASGLDGHNLIAWAGDEIDDFIRTDTDCRATRIHRIMRTSAETRVGTNWLGVCMSYPRTEDGFLLKRHKEALEDMQTNGPEATLFTDLAASWVVRPSIDKNSKTVMSDYKNDPRLAAAMYECMPMPATDAFFEFDEKILQAVNTRRAPVASWRETMGEIRLNAGEVVPCIRVELGQVRPEPGRRYYLSGDGGVTGDAFAVTVWSFPSEGWVDTSSTSLASPRGDAAQRIPNAGGSDYIYWLCPTCAIEDSYMLEAHPYVQQPQGSQWIASDQEDVPVCQCCTSAAPAAHTMPTETIFRTSGWWRSGVPSGLNAEQYEQPEIPVASAPDFTDTVQTGTLVVDGNAIVVPRVRQELVITWSPRLRRRPGDKIVTVDLVNVEQVIGELLERLYVRRAAFDPHQMASMAQRLQGRGGCLVETIPFTGDRQYGWGRTAKALLYSHLLELLPHRLPEPGDGFSYDFRTGEWGHTGDERQLNEWRKLQRKGKKLDHPPGGSKDIYDADALGISLAVNDWMGKVDITWTD